MNSRQEKHCVVCLTQVHRFKNVLTHIGLGQFTKVSGWVGLDMAEEQ